MLIAAWFVICGMITYLCVMGNKRKNNFEKFLEKTNQKLNLTKVNWNVHRSGALHLCTNYP